jgi:hypothetical protein
MFKESAMKRSSKVILLFMGTAAAGGVTMGAALASSACDPVRPGFAMPGGAGDNQARCMTRGGFGHSSHHFTAHAHSHSGGG